jgi:hypothetical protein
MIGNWCPVIRDDCVNHQCQFWDIDHRTCKISVLLDVLIDAFKPQIQGMIDKELEIKIQDRKDG